MSRGSYFELLKRNRTATAEDLRKMQNVLDALRDDGTAKADDVWMVGIGNGPWGEVADKFTGTVYDSVLHLRFNSSFSSLRENCEGELGMDAHGNDRMKIDERTAQEMLKAVDYVLHGNFDPEIERIVGKIYVEIFGDLDRKYSLWSYRQMFPEDKEYAGSDVEDRRGDLLDIRTVLNAYLIATRENPWKNGPDYLLTYVIWG